VPTGKISKFAPFGKKQLQFIFASVDYPKATLGGAPLATGECSQPTSNRGSPNHGKCLTRGFTAERIPRKRQLKLA
jgi:hypothetical protein